MNSSGGLKEVLTRVVSEAITEKKSNVSKAIKVSNNHSDKIPVHFVSFLSV